MNRQFPALTGAAMILIVLNHTIEMGLNARYSHGLPPIEGGWKLMLTLLQGLGIFAVPTFLFVSGAFVAYAARGKPPRLNRVFLRRSLAHIFWPYLIWSAAFYVLLYLHYERTFTPAGYLKNLMVGYPFHFVPLLLFFYLISPLLVGAARRFGAVLVAAFGIYQLVLVLALQADFLPSATRILAPPGIRTTLADWAVFFPLGLVYGMQMKSWLETLRRLRFWLAASTLALFILAAAHHNKLLEFPPAGILAAACFVLCLPVIGRNSLPFVEFFELIGRRAYGIYLTHLILLDLTLWAAGTLGPEVVARTLLILPLLFSIGLIVPLLFMFGFLRLPTRFAYRYVFG